MNQLSAGAHYLFSGFYLITRPGLKRFVLIPLIINILLFVVMFFIARHFIVLFNGWIEGYLPTWLQWLSWIIWLLFMMSFFLVLIFTFVTLANLLAAPFNSVLSEKVELYLTDKKIESRGLLASIQDAPRVFGRQLAILLYYLPRALICLLLFLLPIIHIFITIIWLLFNAWFMALTYLDYPTDNHHVSFKEMRDWLSRRRLVGLGFGLSVLVVTMIPGINLFVIPAAVAGATKAWLEG